MQIEIPNLPTLSWLGAEGDATIDGAALTLRAGPNTDWFNDPDGPTRAASAPVLGFAVTGDCQISAHVSVGFGSAFDAGVLFVHQSDDDYAKLCFEHSPLGDNMVVSVVTRGISDDANGPVIQGDSVHVRVSRYRSVIAFHSSLDGMRWDMVRFFALRNPGAPTSIGFSSQSPTGQSCSSTFADIRYTQGPLDELRNGT
jgi:regulation of enolase protein 1 (concanavalin A-like superfamily)